MNATVSDPMATSIPFQSHSSAPACSDRGERYAVADEEWIAVDTLKGPLSRGRVVWQWDGTDEQWVVLRHACNQVARRTRPRKPGSSLFGVGRNVLKRAV